MTNPWKKLFVFLIFLYSSWWKSTNHRISTDFIYIFTLVYGNFFQEQIVFFFITFFFVSSLNLELVNSFFFTNVLQIVLCLLLGSERRWESFKLEFQTFSSMSSLLLTSYILFYLLVCKQVSTSHKVGDSCYNIQPKNYSKF